MKFNRYLFGFYLGFSLLGSSLNAQQQPASAPIAATVPRLVNFSGKTADAQGKPIAGIAGVTLSIYKEQYEGAPLWLETQNIQADTKGNYTVQLGATKPNGLPLDLFSSGDARWLGVTVNGGQEQPRVLLLSVPYALKAADAETIGGLPPSAFVLANKSQGAGTSTKPAATASTGAAKNTPPPTNPAVTGKGALDFIPMWDSSSDIVNSLIFQKSSQIGINTTSPAATLDVNGKSDMRDTLTLFPKGTDSTLAVNGTAFKVDQTGKVAFVSGQTFPGTGTVTSVGLSAPSSDFTVTGSPVTKSGTLNLNWNVAPTSTNTVNAIVKRDAAGNFSTNGISSLGLSATNTVFPIVATMTGNTPQTAAVTGTATATGIGNTYGVAGYSSTGNGVGVFGQASSNIGLYGAGAVGVFGTGSSFGFQTDSHVQQARGMSGWVKAMVEVQATTPPYQIVRCFNSTLTGPASTTPPCGFNFTESSLGTWNVDFGFEVDDRFLSATLIVTGDINGSRAFISAGAGGTQAVVDTWDSGGSYTNASFYLFVF
jgi:hypothetical protein